MAERIRERDIQRAIIDYLTYTGWYVLRLPPSIYSKKGIPDLFAIKQGFGIWIEVKSPRGKLNNEQVGLIQKLKEHGAYVAVFNDVDIAINELRALNNLIKKGVRHELYKLQKSKSKGSD